MSNHAVSIVRNVGEVFKRLIFLGFIDFDFRIEPLVSALLKVVEEKNGVGMIVHSYSLVTKVGTWRKD
jgi:hypothetical protein